MLGSTGEALSTPSHSNMVFRGCPTVAMDCLSSGSLGQDGRPLLEAVSNACREGGGAEEGRGGRRSHTNKSAVTQMGEGSRKALVYITPPSLPSPHPCPPPPALPSPLTFRFLPPSPLPHPPPPPPYPPSPGLPPDGAPAAVTP